MGQAASLTLSNKTKILYQIDHFSERFKMAKVSIPLVIIAFPVLNAYDFSEFGYTGIKMMDKAIGGLFGVIGWPLSPFLACWGHYQNILKNIPKESKALSQEIKEKAREAIGIRCDNYYNVAVIGRQGTGKSSIINGILGYKDENNYAASISELSHNKHKIAGYRNTTLKRLYLWDMPAIDLGLTRMEAYCEANYLEVFDCVIVVIDRSVLEADTEIASVIQKKGIPMLIVRNKCDEAINSKICRFNSMMKDQTMQWATAAGKLVKETRKYIYEELRKKNVSSTDLFLVSAHTIRELVNSVNSPNYMEKNLLLIDEARLLKSLMNVLIKKNKPLTVEQAVQQIIDQSNKALVCP
ncbi:P-loop containing nucleoside triphosphate hydrolase protein [Pilobolus umbonatus]|nr:P-loop containing nucleoside triphosphate hydrolase protein [Pilobolus umbonatus]